MKALTQWCVLSWTT